MKIFVCIISCSKNSSRIKNIRDTWIKDLIKNNIEYRIFLGKSTPLNSDTVCLNVDDNYENLSNKSIQAFSFCLKNFNFDYLLKVDDDTFVDVENLLKMKLTADYVGWVSTLSQHKKYLKVYSSYMNKRSLRKNLSHEYFKKIDKDFCYAVGAFYLLSRETLQKILKEAKQDAVFNEILQEDIGIGYLCSKTNATIHDIASKMHWYQISENIFFHPVNSVLLKKLHEIKNFDSRKKILQDKILLNNFYRFNLNEKTHS